jgi:predicted ATPase
MIKRFYVHNFRCLENFELQIAGRSSSLLIGRNGAGKSTVGDALGLLQRIARGTNRVRDIASLKDMTRGRSDVPLRFELEAVLQDALYHYQLALELPQGFRELRVAEERLTRDGVDVFTRETAQVTLSQSVDRESRFVVDWHLVALPLIQVQSETDPLQIFKEWLARMFILAPIPSLIRGDSVGDTLLPNKDCSNFGEWFTGILAHSPAAYTHIDKYIRTVMPDFKDIKNPVLGKDSRCLSVQFQQDNASLIMEFDDLSDGEKCFFVAAAVLASHEAYGPVFCFWDEPDNYISLAEAGHFVMDLRRTFQSGGQFLATSHNPEAIRRFSAENTYLLHRHSHLEPTLIRLIEEIEVGGDLVDALIRGDVEI